jgi:hypothetical protein
VSESVRMDTAMMNVMLHIEPDGSLRVCILRRRGGLLGRYLDRWGLRA